MDDVIRPPNNIFDNSDMLVDPGKAFQKKSV